MAEKKLLYMVCVADSWCTMASCVPLSKHAYFDKERAILEAVEDAEEHGRPMSKHDISMLREKGQTQFRQENYVIDTIYLI